MEKDIALKDGYSQISQGEEFTSKAKSNLKLTLIIVPIVLIIVLSIAFFLIKDKEAFIPIAIMASVIILLVLVYVSIKARADRTFEGVLEEKKIKGFKNKRKYNFLKNSVENGNEIPYYYITPVGVFYIRTADGKTRKVDVSSSNYDYYQVGDKVRHIKGFYGLEPYKKSGRDLLPCINCSRFTPVEEDRCQYCKLPLLK